MIGDSCEKAQASALPAPGGSAQIAQELTVRKETTTVFKH
jgi:hypothetical protein